MPTQVEGPGLGVVGGEGGGLGVPAADPVHHLDNLVYRPLLPPRAHQEDMPVITDREEDRQFPHLSGLRVARSITDKEPAIRRPRPAVGGAVQQRRAAVIDDTGADEHEPARGFAPHERVPELPGDEVRIIRHLDERSLVGDPVATGRTGHRNRLIRRTAEIASGEVEQRLTVVAENTASAPHAVRRDGGSVRSEGRRRVRPTDEVLADRVAPLDGSPERSAAVGLVEEVVDAAYLNRGVRFVHPVRGGMKWYSGRFGSSPRNARNSATTSRSGNAGEHAAARRRASAGSHTTSTSASRPQQDSSAPSAWSSRRTT